MRRGKDRDLHQADFFYEYDRISGISDRSCISWYTIANSLPDSWVVLTFLASLDSAGGGDRTSDMSTI